MKSIPIVAVIVLLFVGCNNSNKMSYAKLNPNTIQDSIYPGKRLMETNCYACHNATTTEENRIAPPMIAIKRRYILKDTSKEAFIADMQNWVKNPNEKDAKMFGAVRRFGVMQKIPYPEETIEKIAEYIYDYDIEQPVWFEAHYNKMRGNMFNNNN
tara:strand:- start:275 stop:742 length:468 start_codon:yes stop_codon:yes gene_type:complete